MQGSGQDTRGGKQQLCLFPEAPSVPLLRVGSSEHPAAEGTQQNRVWFCFSLLNPKRLQKV